MVKSISRLARNTVDTLEIVRELTELRISILFEKENINTQNMSGELLLTILSSLAQSESFSISKNEKWSIQKRFEQGTYIIACPPYGYKNVDGGHPVPRWMMDNIFTCTDPAGNIKPDKEKSTEKIDGAVATIMALDRAIRCGNDNGESVYDSRGLLFV